MLVVVAAVTTHAEVELLEQVEQVAVAQVAVVLQIQTLLLVPQTQAVAVVERKQIAMEILEPLPMVVQELLLFGTRHNQTNKKRRKYGALRRNR
jgi:hypothetical protein